MFGNYIYIYSGLNFFTICGLLFAFLTTDLLQKAKQNKAALAKAQSIVKKVVENKVVFVKKYAVVTRGHEGCK